MDDIEKIRKWVKETREFLETFDMEHHREKKYTAEDFKKENDDVFQRKPSNYPAE